MLIFFSVAAIYLFLILLVVLLVYLSTIAGRLNALLQSVEKIRLQHMPEEKETTPGEESKPVKQPSLAVPAESEAEIPQPLPLFEDTVPLKVDAEAEPAPVPETPPPRGWFRGGCVL